MGRSNAAPWVALLIALCGSACRDSGTPGSSGHEALVVYSGRNQALIGPILEKFEESSAVELNVRYASTSELVATLLEEGDATPADVFISQDAAALGALSAARRLRPLRSEILGLVAPRFRGAAGDWVGISGRARSVVFEPSRITEEELPQSLAELAAEQFRGRFGLAPANGSFQAHMAVFGVVHGREALRDLLVGVVANEPGRYPKNSAIVEAVDAGEIDFGLVNHYYLWRAKVEDPKMTAQNYFMPEGEASSFINLAGAAVLSERPSAQLLVAHLLSPEAQEYFAAETFEYPLRAGVLPVVELAPLETIATPAVEYGRVADALSETLTTIAESGLID